MKYKDPPHTLIRLGSELRKRRLARGLTQAQLAEHARLDRKVAIRAERGDPTVAIGNFARLLDVIGASLSVEVTHRPTLEEVSTFFPDE